MLHSNNSIFRKLRVAAHLAIQSMRRATLFTSPHLLLRFTLAVMILGAATTAVVMAVAPETSLITTDFRHIPVQMGTYKGGANDEPKRITTDTDGNLITTETTPASPALADCGTGQTTCNAATVTALPNQAAKLVRLAALSTNTQPMFIGLAAGLTVANGAEWQIGQTDWMRVPGGNLSNIRILTQVDNGQGVSYMWMN